MLTNLENVIIDLKIFSVYKLFSQHVIVSYEEYCSVFLSYPKLCNNSPLMTICMHCKIILSCKNNLGLPLIAEVLRGQDHNLHIILFDQFLLLDYSKLKKNFLEIYFLSQ